MEKIIGYTIGTLLFLGIIKLATLATGISFLTGLILYLLVKIPLKAISFTLDKLSAWAKSHD